MDELAPLMKEFTAQPVAFLGGFFSGVLRLNLNEDPVKSWLDRQSATGSTPPAGNNGHNSGPQSITIE